MEEPVKERQCQVRLVSLMKILKTLNGAADRFFEGMGTKLAFKNIFTLLKWNTTVKKNTDDL